MPRMPWRGSRGRGRPALQMRRRASASSRGKSDRARSAFRFFFKHPVRHRKITMGKCGVCEENKWENERTKSNPKPNPDPNLLLCGHLVQLNRELVERLPMKMDKIIRVVIYTKYGRVVHGQNWKVVRLCLPRDDQRHLLRTQMLHEASELWNKGARHLKN